MGTICLSVHPMDSTRPGLINFSFYKCRMARGGELTRYFSPLALLRIRLFDRFESKPRFFLVKNGKIYSCKKSNFSDPNFFYAS
jgi:hypothetical protein